MSVRCTYGGVQVLRNLSKANGGIGSNTWLFIQLKFRKVLQKIIIYDPITQLEDRLILIVYHLTLPTSMKTHQWNK
jgi:hypothetical protein